MKRKKNIREKSPLEIYLNGINNLPLLNEEEEKIYAIRKDNGDEYAKKKLIESNLRFVVNVAKKYQGRGLSLDDLICEGNIGLMRAVEKYDHKKGYHLISYAVWWIRQKILKSLYEQNIIRIPLNRKDQLCKIEKKLNENPGGTYPEKIQKIAKELNISGVSIDELLNVSKEMISLDEPLYEEDALSIKDCIKEKKYHSVEESAIESCLKDDIKKIFEYLPPREAEVLEYHFGLNGKLKSSLIEIGNKFKITKERIRQIEEKALEKLKNPIIKEKLISYVE